MPTVPWVTVSSPRQLSIALLGPPEIEVDGKPLAVDTRKAVALLAYLAVTKSLPSRDQLATLLWPDLDAERGRATLRRTLSALRTGLGGRWLGSDRNRVWLEPAGCEVDVDRAHSLSAPEPDHGHGPDQVCPHCAEPLAAAARLHRDSFLAGFYLRDSPDFEDWQRSEEERQIRSLRRILDRLALALAAGGRFQDAAAAARRRVEIDPLDEPARRQLMQLLSWDGDRSGAMRVYRDCAAILDRELGVSPLPETRLLYEQIVEGREPSAPAGRVVTAAVTVPVETKSPAAFPFFGREAELESLRDASQPLVLVVGEEGIGKTRLVEHWLSILNRRTARAAGVPGSDASAYMAIRDALVIAAELGVPANMPPESGEAARLVPELVTAGIPQPPAADAGPGAISRFQAGLGTAFAHLLADGILFIDDAQWIDKSSMATLLYMLTHPAPSPPKLVLAMREERIDLNHPLLQLSRKMERGGQALRLTLGPLSEDSAHRLIIDRAGRILDRGTVDRIARQGGGNPLYLLAYIETADEEQSELPAGLEQLVSARVAGLDETARQVLSAVAVLGTDSELDMVKRVGGRSDEEMVVAIETLVQRRLLRETGGGVAFTHDVLRRGAYDRISAARRRLLHSRAADELERGNHRSASARHLELAGRTAEAARAHLDAGHEAMEVYAYPEARRHLEAALALGHPRRGDINVLLGDAAARLGEYGRALAAYEAVGIEQRDVEVERRIGDVYQRLGRWQLADAAYLAAAGLTTEPIQLGIIAAERALVAHRQGDQEGARNLAAQALRMAEESVDASLLARAYNLNGILSADPDEGVALLRKAADLAESTARPDLLAASLNNLALALRRRRDLEGADATARRALAVLEPLGDRHLLAALHSNLADTLHAAGDDVKARWHLTESARLFAEVGLEEGEWEPEIWKLSEW